MDFYNLQERDHRLLERSLLLPTERFAYKDYLEKNVFNFEKILNRKSILLVEEEPRIQWALRKLIEEVNPEAQCWMIEAVEEITDLLEEIPCDLLIVNSYLSEDEIDYDFLDQLRARRPCLEVLVFSHVNDREYYEMLDKISAPPRQSPSGSLSFRLKNFLASVLGG